MLNYLIYLITHLSWYNSLIYLLWNQPFSLPSPCSLSSGKLILNLEWSWFFSVWRESKVSFKMLLDFSLHSWVWVQHLVQKPASLFKAHLLIFGTHIFLHYYTKFSATYGDGYLFCLDWFWLQPSILHLKYFPCITESQPNHFNSLHIHSSSYWLSKNNIVVH